MKTTCIFLYISILISSAVFAQTPIAYYPLDGNANDVSGSNFNGTISGSPTSTTNRWSAAGTALSFNGSSDYIDLPTSFDFPNRTIIVWFNASQIDASNNGNLVYTSDHGSIQYGLTAILVKNSNGADSLVLATGTNSRYKTPVTTSQWYQVAIVRSTTVAKFYVNGTLVNSVNAPNSLHSSDGPTHAIIGADRYYNSPFNGKIDDLRIYDSALTDGDIGVNYTSIKEVRELDSKLQLTTQGGNVFFALDDQATKEIKSVSIFDISGKLISENNFASPVKKLNDRELLNGTYIVKFFLNDELKSVDRKFVIAK